MKISEAAAADARHPWREHIETLSVAIVMALVLKYFTLEAFQIPTGSMQPTLMGLDTSRSYGGQGSGLQVFDRILVDKLAPFYKDPQRWEVWVFLYPLDRSNRYIKRVVGLPGEEIKVAYGDLFVRRSEREEWKILRKPLHLQQSLWREVWSSDADVRPGDFWNLTGFEEKGSALVTEGAAHLAKREVVKDGYLDGYPRGIRKALSDYERSRPGPNPVRDMRIRATVRPGAQHKSLTLGLVWGSDQLRAEISGPTGDGAHRIFLNDREVRTLPGMLGVERAATIEFWRSDERVGLTVDGVSVDPYEFASVHSVEDFNSRTRMQTNDVSVDTDGGKLVVESLALDRDVHYTNTIANDDFSTVKIPDGEYFMMGDNSGDSLDGRFWKEKTIEFEDPVLGRITRSGAMRTSGASTQVNPRRYTGDGRLDAQAAWIFRDHFGEEYRFPQEARDVATPFQHTVPRDYFLGRAFFVFWPLPPMSPSARLGLIR